MKKQNFRLRLLPVLAYAAFVLLIIRAHSFYTNLEGVLNIAADSSTEQWDLFCYGKSSAILIITIWAALTMAYLLITGQMKIKKTKIYIPMLIYVLCVVVSYALSDYKLIAWVGVETRFEGTKVILCYMFMLFYTINVVDDIRDAIYVVLAALSGAFLACLIGLTQLIGHDILLTDAAALIYGLKEGQSLVGWFLPGQVYQTVSNMNYVGIYLSLLLPVLIFAIYYFLKEKNRNSLLEQGINDKKRKMIALLTVLLLAVFGANILGAGSLGGFLGAGVGISFLMFSFLKKKWQKIAFGTVLIIGVALFLTAAYCMGADNHRQLDYIDTGIDCVKISLNGNEITIAYNRDMDEIDLSDSDGKRIKTRCFPGEEGLYQVRDPRFAGEMVIIPVKDVNDMPCVIVDVKDDTFGFTFYEDGTKYLNPFGQDVSLCRVESMGFEGHLTAGSGRGYIWSRTIPLLKNYILFGAGADTFLLVFPQGDYAGKFSAGASLSTVFSKPHNMFLGIFVGTGLISLIAFFFMNGMAIYKVMTSSKEMTFAKAITAGIVGFLFAGMFNDSTVGIMPMFYSLLGIIISLGI